MDSIIRIIPVLFIKDGLIVRSQSFSKHLFIGNVIEQAKRLNDYNVDELIYIDISRENKYDLGRNDLFIKSKEDILSIISSISKVCFMPLSFGGKIRTVQDATNRIRAGADKIIINSLLFNKEKIVSEIVKEIGSQAVVGSIDYKIINNEALVFNKFGKNNTKIKLLDFIKYIEDLNIGELFIQNVDKDGSQNGYDTDTIQKVVKDTSLPVIACSGAGTAEDFIDPVKIKNISGVAAGNLFNYTERSYPNVKKILKKNNLNVR